MKKMKKRMKKVRKRIDKVEVVFNMSPSFKMSELISRYASDYINMGDNTKERQSLLNGACSTWNIALLPEYLREDALRHQVEEYRRINPGVDDSENVIHDMRLLIRRKLEIFPDVRKFIVGAFIEPINEKQYRINIVSTDNPGQLKNMFVTTSSERNKIRR